MNCPACDQHEHVEVDTHADGFASNIQECGDCGTLWTNRGDEILILHGATRSTTPGHLVAECPICHETNSVEVDIHADGFASNLEECSVCGAVWSFDQTRIRILHGATWAR